MSKNDLFAFALKLGASAVVVSASMRLISQPSDILNLAGIAGILGTAYYWMPAKLFTNNEGESK